MKMNKHNISFLACGGLAHSNRITRWGRSGHAQATSIDMTTLLANNIGAILAQYRHIGSRLANITILGQCWCDIVVPM